MVVNFKLVRPTYQCYLKILKSLSNNKYLTSRFLKKKILSSVILCYKCWLPFKRTINLKNHVDKNIGYSFHKIVAHFIVFTIYLKKM